jgi:hypothetical protein
MRGCALVAARFLDERTRKAATDDVAALIA